MAWHISAGREKLSLAVNLRGGMPHEVSVVIFPPRGIKEPVSTERCHEILAGLPNLDYWIETRLVPDPRVSTARAFAGTPRDEIAPVAERWRGEAPLQLVRQSKWLRTVRDRHLPATPPEDWSAPVADVEDDSWMFRAGRLFLKVGYLEGKGRGTLLSVHVTKISGRASPEDAATVLAELRNVGAFVPAKVDDSRWLKYVADVKGAGLPPWTGSGGQAKPN